MYFPYKSNYAFPHVNMGQRNHRKDRSIASNIHILILSQPQYYFPTFRSPMLIFALCINTCTQHKKLPIKDTNNLLVNLLQTQRTDRLHLRQLQSIHLLLTQLRTWQDTSFLDLQLSLSHSQKNQPFNPSAFPGEPKIYCSNSHGRAMSKYHNTNLFFVT